MIGGDGVGARVLVLSAEPDSEVIRPPMTLDPVLTKHCFMSAIKAPRYVPTMFGGGRLQSD
jgi:sulfopyruvate decarboxylase subunit beta